MNKNSSLGPTAPSSVSSTAVVHPYWFIIGLAYASYFTFGLADNGRGPIFLDLLREFHLSDAEGGFFFFAASAAALINNLVLFGVMERRGPYWTLQAYSLAQAGGLLMVALAPTYTILLVGAVIFGTSFGGLGIAHNVLVSDAAPAPVRRKLLSGLHATYGVASLLIPLMVTLFYHWGWSWRAVVTVLAVAPGFVWLASLSSKQKAISQAHRQTALVGEGHTAAAGKFPRWRAFHYSLIFSFYIVAEIGLSSRLALFVRRDQGFTVELANYLVAGFFAGLLLGRLLVAFVTFRLSDRAIMLIALLASLCFFTLGLLHHPIWLGLTGLSMSVFYPVGMSMVKHETGRDSAYVVSWCITVQALWLMLMHIVLGSLSDWFGLGRALWLGPACLVASIAFLVYPSREVAPPSNLPVGR